MFQFRKFKNLILIIVCVLVLVIWYFHTVFAQDADELRDKINNHSDQIQKLNEEIGRYQKEIDTTVKEAATLQNAIKIIDANTSKLGAEIKKTEVNISRVNNSISGLSEEIADIEKKIGLNSKAVAESINNLRRAEENTMVEIFLGSGSMAEAFDEYHTMGEFQQSVRNRTALLSQNKDELGVKRTAIEGERRELVGLRSSLGDQKTILDINKKEKKTLLTETKNKESEYKKILAEKQAQKEKFERELFEFESRLKIIIDPNSFAAAGKGVLAWPLQSVFITQPFGATRDSKRLYVSGTHNGIDFRASRGTPILAALSGVVEAVGNTDEQRGCYSYGKWVLIHHPNGLSTLYAHLDLIKVTSGNEVNTGDIIGYSGQTGYATGPHLHFTLYATQGVRVERYSQSINCKNTTIPIAPSNAYLDPMQYLPSL